MGLETVNYVGDLIATNPTSNDPKSQGDDQLRNIKTAVLKSFAGFTGAILVAGTDGGSANAYTVTTGQSLAAYSTKMLILFAPVADSTGASTINVDGIGAKNIKTDAGAAIGGGDLVANRLYLGAYSGTEVRLLYPLKNYIDQLVFAPVLPAQSGNSGKFLKTDGTNASWDYAGISTVGATVTDNYTIASSTPTIWPCATTALGKSITAPVVTTSTPKGLFGIVDNKNGGYPVGWRDSTGALIVAVAPGGVAQVYLEDNSTAAGTWRVTGNNLEPGLITIDNTFSSTYGSTAHKPFVALDSNKSIHFLTIASNGFAAVAVDNTTGAVGTPLTISTTASDVPKAAFKIDSTHAIVFYGATNDTLYGAVITLSGATTLAVGSSANSGSNTNIAVEDCNGAYKIAQLDTNLFLVSWATATGAGNTSVMGVQVSGSTTVNFGSKADIITSNNVVNSTQTFALTTTTGAVSYKDAAAAPYNNKCCVVSVTNANPPVCTVNASATLTGVGSSLTGVTPTCLLSSTKLLLVDDNNTSGSAIASVFTFSGTTTTAGTAVSVETGITTSVQFGTNSATRYNPHLFKLSASTALFWYADNNPTSRAVILSESGGTVTAGSKLYGSIANAAAGAIGGGQVMPQGTAEFIAVMQQGAAAGYANLTLVPHKISGSTITTGANCSAPEVLQATSTGIFGKRLSSGDLVFGFGNLGGGSLSVGTSRLKVVRSNGDAINDRGTIKIPNLVRGDFAIADVASNRLAIFSAGGTGTTVGGSTAQMRHITLEIAQ